MRISGLKTHFNCREAVSVQNLEFELEYINYDIYKYCMKYVLFSQMTDFESMIQLGFPI